MNNDSQRKISTILLVIAVVFVTFALIMRLTSFGYIDVSDIGNNSLILIDGKKVSPQKIHVKTGAHQVVIFNKNSSNYADVVNVSRFKSSRPSIKTATDSQIAIQSLSAWKWGFTEQDLRDVVQKDSYIVGGVSQGSISPFVLQYDNGWRVLYFNNSSFVNNRDLIPSSILPYVQGIEAKYADR